MSLTSAMYTGVSGLLTNSDAMNVIGNNISNANTVGFKESRSVFSDVLSANLGNNSQVGRGVQMQAVQNIFTQGSSQQSENITDLSIQGNSFFALTDPSTTSASSAITKQNKVPFLARAGAFTVDKDLYLVNPDGYKVLGTDGKPIQFKNSGSATDTDFGKVTKIDTDGLITYLGTDGKTLNYYQGSGATGSNTLSSAVRVAVVTASDPGALTKVGGSLYQGNADAGVSTGDMANAIANGNSEKVLSNTLEQSNVDLASEFVKMITTQRAYSANSKTITTTDQMTQEILSLIR